ncbi:NAD(P)/FAD-dependent oxidoreductase [Marinobacterium sediminicola]|uniref:NADH dehydrogenase n=1 Tax=Marinobacterium sediminicola TaxID=518898 RepID=A0ABY1RXF7_9GAMM|nr:NAD(P)/FAD-dependent oxidoreductase [Marinobacterium sediminicola]ULG67759.1 NAD(P)/FAD-dependent oxidoreductase [Marinobacterium sediminicola]SMR71594.1 NADH dehydrogenase [Marinobacterium sediminicola]
MEQTSPLYQHVVVVGGGAGGLELATRLARKYRRKGLKVTLVDREPTHIWKPLLHEVATGSLDAGIDELSYSAQARSAGFKFQVGQMDSIDREQRCIHLAAVKGQNGQTLLPVRTLYYDYLVMAVGSVTNDFGVDGVAEHCTFLDSRKQAEQFRRTLLEACLKASNTEKQRLRIAIVGAGATGVELSAELFNTARELAAYGISKLDRNRLEVILIEAGPRILPALPDRISSAARHELEKLGVQVRQDTRITSVNEEGLMTDTGELIEAELKVWAAGIRAPEFITRLDGLEFNRLNQLVVGPDLRTTQDERIFALGDCAACARADGNGNVPPRAQAAHQMASFLFKNFRRIVKGEPLPAYEYKDYGSLVSLSRFSTVGSLMGNLTNGSMMVEGRLARLVYVSLYRLHQLAVYGYTKTFLITLVDRINKVIRPRLKLH